MLLSRVADALYWLSRYLERAEHTARVIDVRLDLGLDRNAEGWDFDRLYAGLRIATPEDAPHSPAALVDQSIFDLTNEESVASSVTSARENARQVREEIALAEEEWKKAQAIGGKWIDEAKALGLFAMGRGSKEFGWALSGKAKRAGQSQAEKQRAMAKATSRRSPTRCRCSRARSTRCCATRRSRRPCWSGTAWERRWCGSSRVSFRRSSSGSVHDYVCRDFSYIDQDTAGAVL